jgi:citrate lyase subunit beta/citryl-CoA lyase
MTVCDALAAAQTFLFVPADRPERFDKAEASGADLIIIDLEDAVSPAAKDDARGQAARWLSAGHQCVVRVNAEGTIWHTPDLEMVAVYDCIVMVPKAEVAVAIGRIAGALTAQSCVMALIETSAGVLSAPAIARVPGVERLAFGSFDLAAQLGVDPANKDAMYVARSALVLGSCAAGLTPPVDGVTGAPADDATLVEESRYAKTIGFGARLCIHPRQVPLVAGTFQPTTAEVEWASTVLAVE